jgi:hypothetical protein
MRQPNQSPNRMQEDVDALENKMHEGKASLAAAYAVLNRNYEEQRMAGHNGARSQTLSDVTRTYADNTSQGTGSDKKRLIRSDQHSSGSPHHSRGQYYNGMGKFMETEDLEKLNMLAAAQKVAAYHVQQSPLLTVVRTSTLPYELTFVWPEHAELPWLLLYSRCQTICIQYHGSSLQACT